MENIILAAILVIVVGAAALYIYKAKKSGKKCIGCPDSGTCCSGSCASCSCSCSGNKEA